MATPKTNAMRMLDKEKIPYQMHTYDASDGHIDGEAVARKVGMDPAKVFKTLVTRGHSGSYYVCVLPVERELDLKKAAKVFSEKSLEMIPVAQLLPTTGYVRGGCSPIGMKKRFATVFDELAKQLADRGQARRPRQSNRRHLRADCGGMMMLLTEPKKGDENDAAAEIGN